MQLGKLFRALLWVCALVLTGQVHAQASRTWVSGVGDDANPCSRTAPCKTFAGAISKTAAGGIINVIDDCGCGALTITKSITIRGSGHTASLLASGGINAVNVNAGIDDRIVLRNLQMEGNGTTLGLNGIRITQAKSVKIYNSQISNFSRSGVTIEPNAATAVKVLVAGSDIFNNGGTAVNAAPRHAATVKATVRNNDINDNACGIVAVRTGMDNLFNFANECATAGAASGVAATAIVNSFRNSINDNSTIAVFSRGGTATNRIGANEITGNTTGLRFVDGGQLISFGDNWITGNTNNGVPTATIGTSRPSG
jgi:hypothetical protein